MNLLDVTMLTPRLLLRPFHTGDRHVLLRLLLEPTDSHPQRPKPDAELGVDSLLSLARLKLVLGQTYSAAIDLRSGESIGGCQIDNLDSATPSVALQISAAHQRQGYAFEALTAIREWSQRSLTIEYLRFLVLSDSAAGLQLAQKCRGVRGDEWTLTEVGDIRRQIIEFWLFP